MRWLSMQPPQTALGLIFGCLTGVWLICNALRVLVGEVVREWRRPLPARARKGPGPSVIPVPSPPVRLWSETTKTTAPRPPLELLALDGAAPQSCKCRFWNPLADRPEWLPCGDHLEILIRQDT